MNDVEYDRMVTTHMKLNQIVDNIKSLGVFPSLVWVWCWDIVRYKWRESSIGEDIFWEANPKFTEDDIFQMMWQDSTAEGWSLEYGAESVDEAIFNWMVDRDILLPIGKALDEEEEEDADE